MIRIYRYATILAIAGSLALAACSTEEPQSQVRPADGRIYLQFPTDGSAEAANEGLGSDVESRVETADVFIYDGEQCLYYERLSIPENAAPVPLSETVATDFVMGQQYEVRVVANYRDGEDGNEPFPADEASWPSRTALAEMIAVTSQLVNSTEATVTPLLMEGATDAQLNDGTGNLVEVSVPLTRAAVKIVVEVSIGDPVRTEDTAADNPGGYIETSYSFYGGTLGRLHNAADRVRMVAGNELSLAELDGHLVTTEKWNSYEVASDDRSTLSFYSYPNDWSGAHTIEQETFVNVDIPVSVRTQRYTADGQPVGEATVEQKAHNYYKVQLNYGQDAATNNKLQRNHLYRIRAKLRTLGSSTPEVPVELDPQCTFEILDWQKITIDVNPDAPHFLVLRRKAVKMANTAQDSVYFVSTSPLNMASGATRVVEAYYFNDLGQKTAVDAGEFYPTLSQSDGSGYTGYLKIASATPTNNVPKYIRITVENQQGITDTLFVEQYPLEYITSELSWYSYVNDGTLGQDGSSCFSWEVKPRCTPGGWEGGLEYRIGYGGSEYKFFSKVVLSTNAGVSSMVQYYYRADLWDRNWNDWELETYSNSHSDAVTKDLKNAQLYTLHLTSTSGQYVMGIPALDDNGYTASDTDNANIVSPQLMTASQLGGTKAWSNADEVRRHCAQYAEKTSNGVVYDDWRLPTRAEIDVMIDLQYRTGSAVKTLFPAKYYWCADGVYFNSNPNASWYDSGGSSNWGAWYRVSETQPAVRCVRDVKADK